jgi:hypothetical protein
MKTQENLAAKLRDAAVRSREEAMACEGFLRDSITSKLNSGKPKARMASTF